MLDDVDVCAMALKFSVPTHLLKAISLHLFQLISDDMMARGSARNAIRQYLLDNGVNNIQVHRAYTSTKYKNREYVDTFFTSYDGSYNRRVILSVSDVLAFLDQ